jgi:hypothetical protein
VVASTGSVEPIAGTGRDELREDRDTMASKQVNDREKSASAVIATGETQAEAT